MKALHIMSIVGLDCIAYINGVNVLHGSHVYQVTIKPLGSYLVRTCLRNKRRLEVGTLHCIASITGCVNNKGSQPLDGLSTVREVNIRLRQYIISLITGFGMQMGRFSSNSFVYYPGTNS